MQCSTGIPMTRILPVDKIGDLVCDASLTYKSPGFVDWQRFSCKLLSELPWASYEEYREAFCSEASEAVKLTAVAIETMYADHFSSRIIKWGTASVATLSTGYLASRWGFKKTAGAAYATASLCGVIASFYIGLRNFCL